MQQALFTLLDGDAGLSANISGIYDFVPEAATYPYALFSDSTASDFSNPAKELQRVQLALQLYSRQHGRKEALELASSVRTLTHHADLTVTGWTLLSLESQTAKVRSLSDGLTWLAELQLTALLERA